jgi:outer membrane receptor protein involved in Fe transport
VGFFYNRVENHTLFASGNRGFADSPAFAYLNYLAYYYDPNFPVPAPPSLNWFTGVYDSTLDQLAVFGEVSFDITENFTVTAGGRWFDTDQDRTLQQGALFPLGTEPDCAVDLCYTDERASSSESGFVPKFTAAYGFDDDDKMVYFTYSEGFRRGGGNAARPISVFGVGKPLHEFDSDEIQNYEIGAKTTWAGGRFLFNITAYHMVWEDIQIQANDPNIFTLGFVNFPEAEIDGVEGNIAWIPAEGWDISGTFGYNDAEISKTATLFAGTAGEKTAVKGTPLPLMPDWKASAAVQYSFQTELLSAQPYIRADYQHVGESFNSLEGIQSIIFDNPVRTQESYDIMNVRIGLEGDGWSAAFFINNIWDERAEQFFNDRWAQTRISVNRPRTFGINYRKQFN